MFVKPNLCSKTQAVFVEDLKIDKNTNLFSRSRRRVTPDLDLGKRLVILSVAIKVSL